MNVEDKHSFHFRNGLGKAVVAMSLGLTGAASEGIIPINAFATDAIIRPIESFRLPQNDNSGENAPPSKGNLRYIGGPIGIAKDTQCKTPMIEVNADEFEARTAKGEYALKTSIRNSTNTNGVITFDEPIVSYFVDDPNGMVCK